jgi:hypothetical protein
MTSVVYAREGLVQNSYSDRLAASVLTLLYHRWLVGSRTGRSLRGTSCSVPSMLTYRSRGDS